MNPSQNSTLVSRHRWPSASELAALGPKWGEVSFPGSMGHMGSPTAQVLAAGAAGWMEVASRLRALGMLRNFPTAPATAAPHLSLCALGKCQHLSPPANLVGRLAGLVKKEVGRT